MQNQNGQPELIMKSLTLIRQESYQENPGKYKGTITYTSGPGGRSRSEHSLTLDEVISERVLAFIGPVICEAAAMVAEETKRNIQWSLEALNNQKAIEAGALVNVPVGEKPPQESPDQPAPPIEVPKEPGTDFF